MAADMKPDWIAGTLAGQGVTVDAASARAHAALLAALLGGTTRAFERLDFEDEPAAFTAEQRRNAP